MSRHYYPQAGKQPPALANGQNGHRGRPGGQDRTDSAFARIEFVTMFVHTRVEGHYPGFDLFLDGRKIVKKVSNNAESLEPTDLEASRFLQDMETAAAKDPRIENLLLEYREYTRKK